MAVADQLVIETAASACSVALIADGRVVASLHEDIARGHAERLIPMISALPGGGRAASILVDRGPGSFTGVRVGIAAARALGFAWGAQLRGYSSLDLLAAMAGERHNAADRLLVVMLGGHGEWFVRPYARAGVGAFGAEAALRSMRPEAAVAAFPHAVLAIGNAAPAFAALVAGCVADPIMMRADGALLLPPAACQPDSVPIYGRDADARPLAAGPGA